MTPFQAMFSRFDLMLSRAFRVTLTMVFAIIAYWDVQPGAPPLNALNLAFVQTALVRTATAYPLMLAGVWIAGVALLTLGSLYFARSNKGARPSAGLAQ